MTGKESVVGFVSPADYSKLQEISAREGCRISDIVSRIVSAGLAKTSSEKVVKAKKKTKRPKSKLE